ncbi:hypothetical protein E2C01_042265 [Portunus trituberculatus]|uniref:Uncharacterized protein n=1 Tax=Portunus trituberculatus TaxID=210409 RepID=A0A5B7FPR2_PORTR|nr:hypothetical protein [Portunus trituberculatus]
MEILPTLGPWPGFEPVHLETPWTPKHTIYYENVGQFLSYAQICIHKQCKNWAFFVQSHNLKAHMLTTRGCIVYMADRASGQRSAGFLNVTSLPPPALRSSLYCSSSPL